MSYKTQFFTWNGGICIDQRNENGFQRIILGPIQIRRLIKFIEENKGVDIDAESI